MNQSFTSPINRASKMILLAHQKIIIFTFIFLQLNPNHYEEV